MSGHTTHAEAPSDPYPGPVTLWLSNTTDIAAVISREPPADRGFGRKLLAQLNPTWPITPIGQFPLNRSAPASAGEFYIAGLPEVTIIHTFVDDVSRISRLNPTLRSAVPATDVFAFARADNDTGFGAFAHWHHGELTRAFSARRDHFYEETGLPCPFERPFWAGEHGSPTGIDLPFVPAELVSAAERYWLGIDISPTGPDIHVAGFAIDGRREPKILDSARNTWGTARLSIDEIARAASARLGLTPDQAPYDDYAQPGEEDRPAAELSRAVERVTKTARRMGNRAGQAIRRTARAAARRLRYSDRR